MQSGEPIPLTRDCQAILVPDGITINLPKDTRVFIQQSLGGSYTVITDQGSMVRISSKDADALGKVPTNALKEAPSGASLDDLVQTQLKTVYDPEIPVNIVDLGLVYLCQIKEQDSGRAVKIRMTLTAPGCGMGDVLKRDVEEKLKDIPGIQSVDVELVFDPPWDRTMMSEAAKLQLGMY